MRKLLLGVLLSLTYVLPTYAAERYHIELVIFRQIDVQPVYSSRLAPDNWMGSANTLLPEQLRSSLIDLYTQRLTPQNGYQVILQRSWQQSKSPSFRHVALSSGEESLGHFPVEGVFSIRQDRTNEIKLDFWVNEFQPDGTISTSEHFLQSAIAPYNELTFIDHGNLGAIVRIMQE